jgi:hypothetical protein
LRWEKDLRYPSEIQEILGELAVNIFYRRPLVSFLDRACKQKVSYHYVNDASSVAHGIRFAGRLLACFNNASAFCCRTKNDAILTVFVAVINNHGGRRRQHKSIFACPTLQTGMTDWSCVARG